MLSLVICSRTAELSAALKSNIDNTIGVEYQLVIIDNSAGRYTIFEAYNLGVERSIFAIICFMHDDILYHTKNWGVLTLDHFREEKTGIIGVAGSRYIPYLPGTWWAGSLVNLNILTIEKTHTRVDAADNAATKVIVVDGVWFCVRRSVFEKIRFDEINYTGFHLYDADICMEAWKTGYHTYFVPDILLQHFSKGDVNKTWYDNAIRFNNKWKQILPVASTPLPYSVRCKAELKTLFELSMIMIANGQAVKQVNRTCFLRLFKYYNLYFYYKTYIHLGRYLLRGFGLSGSMERA